MLFRHRLCGLPINLTLIAVVLFFAGSWAASIFPQVVITDYTIFGVTVSLMLATGLYLSAFGIDLSVLRSEFVRVFLAVVVGVLSKAAVVILVASFFSDFGTAAAVGLIFSQVDPLATASRTESGLLSERGSTFLQSWASFDDPTTTLLAVVLLASQSIETGASPINQSVVVWVAVYTLVFLLFLVANRLADRAKSPTASGIVLLSAFSKSYALAAVAGLRYRPALFSRHYRKGIVVLSLAAFLITGLATGASQNWLLGPIVGLSAVIAHAVVSWPMSSGYETNDRIGIATGHQSGLTALVLTLAFTASGFDVLPIAGPGIITTIVMHALLQKSLIKSS